MSSSRQETNDEEPRKTEAKVGVGICVSGLSDMETGVPANPTELMEAAARAVQDSTEASATTEFLAFEARTLAKCHGTKKKKLQEEEEEEDHRTSTSSISDLILPLPAAVDQGQTQRPVAQPGAFQEGSSREEPAHPSDNSTISSPGEGADAHADAVSLAVSMNATESLSVARLVDENDEERGLQIPMAQEYQHPESREEDKDSHRSFLLVTVSVAAVAGIALLLVFLLAKQPNTRHAAAFSRSPTQAPTLSREDLVLQLLPESTHKDVLRPNSHQYKAYQWVLEDPDLRAYPPYRIQQRFALAALYYATSGQHWINQEGWMNYSVHECSWYSRPQFEDVEMHMNSNILSNGFVLMYDSVDKPCSMNQTGGTFQHLWIFKNNLKGTLPWKELALLTDLKSMAVFGNDLEIALSSDLRLFTNLEAIEFSSMDVIGSIPTEIGLLTNMKTILNSANKMTGTIPTELGLLTQLAYVMYSQNQLTGTIPSELGILTTLKWVYFFSNLLSGTIPNTLSLLTNLNYLNLKNNKLTGTIPTDLGLLTNISLISLEENKLTGTIPSQLGLLTNANHGFMLNDNLLSGTIPTQLGAMTGLVGGIFGSGTYGLGLGNNQLVGPLPSELGQLSILERLWVQDNQLSGEIPEELGGMKGLLDCRLQDNLFSGRVPGFEEGSRVWAANNDTLEIWNISGNPLLTGTLPVNSSLCDALVMECSDFLCGCNCTCFGGI